MFALDRPIKVVPGAMLARGDYLWSVQPIRKSRRYDVVSSELSGNEITSRERAEALEVPASISPAVRDLAHSWTAQNHDSRGVVSSALQFFRTQGFTLFVDARRIRAIWTNFSSTVAWDFANIMLRVSLP